MNLEEWLARADELCRQGRYFDAHEELEDAWRAAKGNERLVLHGVIQVSAGLYRLKSMSENPEGAFYLFEHGLQKLRAGKALLSLVELERLETDIARMRVEKKAPERFSLGLKLSPV